MINEKTNGSHKQTGDDERAKKIAALKKKLAGTKAIIRNIAATSR